MFQKYVKRFAEKYSIHLVDTLQIDCFRLFYQAFLEKISLKS